MSSPRSRSDDIRSQLHDALYSALIDKIRRDTYPSTTMMNTVEAGINDDQLGDYADVLLTKIENDQFPSIDLVRRLTAIARWS